MTGGEPVVIALYLIATWAVDITGTITLAFLALWGLLVAIAWLRDWIRRPIIALGRRRCLLRFRDDEDRQRSLAWLDRIGFDARQLRGQWYILRRLKRQGTATVKLPSVPIDTNPRRGID